MEKILYFDSAATSFPKPPSVIRAVSDAMRSCGNPGRGSHALSAAAASLLFDCRSTAASFFDADPENVVFTLNATHALNLAIKGLAQNGGHILIDNFSHNAVYRPALALQSRGCRTEIYDASGDEEQILRELRRRIRRDTVLIAATHQSNICSKVFPAAAVGQLAAEAGIPFVLDASQSAGHIPVSLRKMHISALCVPGHKGLLGPMGTGMLITAPDLRLSTLIEGGAGIRSLDAQMPDELPERLEAGTAALPAAAGLKAGIEEVAAVGTEAIGRHERMLADCFVRAVRGIPSLHTVGETDGSVISFTADGMLPAEIGERLNQKGICVRTGYHCAPLAHRTLGTLEHGTVRVSFSHANTPADVNALAGALYDLCR
ncbi:MAG: aminotransferase class V-fold PLP-dependent enzyme [Clostridia bacterium]|nr:aminotransferase class V-fold PLP-dependent enzyme [Clostridia bacterium]